MSNTVIYWHYSFNSTLKTMKKVILAAALLAATLSSFAQIPAGTISFGGQLGLSTSSSKDKATVGSTTTETDGPSRTSFSFLPQAQFFLMENLSAGVQIGYSLSSDKSTSNSGTVIVETTVRNGGFVFAPFGRYYYMLDDKFGFFGEAGVPLFIGGKTIESKTGTLSNTNESDIFSVGFRVSPGFVFFPTKSVGIEAKLGNLLGVGYTTDTDESNGNKFSTRTTSFDFININTLSFSLGLMYYLKM